MTWQQAAILKADPAQGKKIIDAKEKKFEDAAAKIKEADPDAYEYLTGAVRTPRVGTPCWPHCHPVRRPVPVRCRSAGARSADHCPVRGNAVPGVRHPRAVPTMRSLVTGSAARSPPP